jgi:hypothetical protein
VNTHPPITGAEAADRLAIRELFDAYAHCADRRDAKGQMALFTEDTHFAVYMDTRNPEPTQDLYGREALAPVFDALNARGDGDWRHHYAVADALCVADRIHCVNSLPLPCPSR